MFIKDIKIIFENSGLAKRYLSSPSTLKNTIDLLYVIVKGNLIDIYDNYSLYSKLIFEFKYTNYVELIKSDSNSYFKLLYVLSNFALRTKEFNSIYGLILNDLNLFLKEESNLTNENLRCTLESLAVVELMMKFNLTKENYDEKFSASLITNLLKLYLTRTSDNFQAELKNHLDHLFLKTEKNFDIQPSVTNLLPFYELTYKSKDIPLIIIDSKSGKFVNVDKKLTAEYYILYQNLRSFTKTLPMILDISEVDSMEAFEKNFRIYSKFPNTGFKHYLD
jgi:hypothetical protein